MTYEDLIVLIPSHSLEDFPTELSENEAASLLNAFAVLWHPALLATARVIPSWDRSDEPPETFENRLLVVPTACDDWIPGDWVDRARNEGAVVLSGLSDREEMIEAAVGPLQRDETLDDDLVADFLALGTCYLQMELLTRQMHHFSNFDEAQLQREAISAAEAAIANDATAARNYLRSCFEVLTESRERFYPVDCYLVDLCLLNPRMADEHFERTLAEDKPVNFLIAAENLEQMAVEKPDFIKRLRETWEAATVDVCGGELREGPLPLLPVESVLWEFERGHDVFRKLFARTPTTWGRKRFGLATLIPQILSKFGYHSAIHVVLDDGLYPDAEQSKIRWEGCDGTVVDAMTRIPLAADSATSFLRFATRMSESMQEDQVAAVVFARWPELKTPWMEDLRRMHGYSPALGRFVTLNDFFLQTDDPGRLSTFEAREYLTPFLIQAVAAREKNPVSRFADHICRRRSFDEGCWYRSMAALLTGNPVTGEREHETTIELAGPDGTPEAVESAVSLLKTFVSSSAETLAQVVMQDAGNQAGFLLLNSLSFPRTVSVDLPGLEAAPKIDGAIKAVQFDEAHKSVTVQLPAAGFVWIPAAGEPGAPPQTTGVPIAQENVLRNEFFEVYLNETTGGIAEIKEYGRKPNRLSQQLAFRFPRERTFTIGEGEEARKTKSYYSEMRRLTSEVTCSGPALGEIVTTGEIVNQKKNSKLAGFRQTVRVWRGRPVIEIDIQLDIQRMPDGDPWSNYYAARFAWNDSTASLTRSLLEGAQSFQHERFESPHYFEIATEQERTTILNFGLPFHRKTGTRMLDSLLVTAGETQNRFRFVIAMDVNYPMQAALDAMTPVSVVPTESGPPPRGTSGWFLHINAQNVQVTRIMGLANEPTNVNEPTDVLEPRTEYDDAVRPGGPGFALRLMETEGRHRQVKLRCYKTPSSARQRDFQNHTLSDLTIEEDAVLIDMTAYEIADVELRFER